MEEGGGRKGDGDWLLEWVARSHRLESEQMGRKEIHWHQEALLCQLIDGPGGCPRIRWFYFSFAENW